MLLISLYHSAVEPHVKSTTRPLRDAKESCSSDNPWVSPILIKRMPLKTLLQRKRTLFGNNNDNTKNSNDETVERREPRKQFFSSMSFKFHICVDMHIMKQAGSCDSASNSMCTELKLSLRVHTLVI